MELSNGEVGIVIGQNDVRRLLPKVIVILDEQKNMVADPAVKDLMLDAESDTPVTIRRSLEPGSFGIEPDDFYL